MEKGIRTLRDLARPPPHQSETSGPTGGVLRFTVLRIRVQGSLFRVYGSGFRVQGSMFRVQCSRFMIQGSGIKVQGSSFRFQDKG